MNEITIRPALATDQAALGRYGGALMRLHYQLDPQRFILAEHPEAGYGRFLVNQLGDPECVVLVAEHEGQVVGYAFAGLEPMSWKDLRGACGFLHDVFVDERVRHLGVGSKLVRAAIGWLETQNAPRVVLMSAAKNPGAQGLFDRLGFRRTMVEMTLELGAAASDR
jgi:GNAT superfamily N-acetyltransferase